MNWKTKTASVMLSLGIVLASAPAVSAQGFEVNIMTGGATGTYIQIGNDVASLAKSIGRNVTVVQSAGSMENIEAVRKRRYTQFGIVQSDVLDFIRTFRSEDPAMRRIVRSTRIVFPLYNEEVHIVTRKSSGISVLADLSGKIVGVGAPNSGTNLTTTFLFEVAHTRPETLVTIPASEALDRLREGFIDAFVYVAGAPTRLLAETSASDDLKLIPAANSAVREYYGSSIIKAGTYPWLEEDVPTPAVRAVLMTYEYDPNRNDYFKQSCDAVTEITYLIKENLGVLKETGHPKWNQVDLTAIPPGWERAQCVQTAFDENYRLPEMVSEVVAQQDCSPLLNAVAHRLCLMKNSANQ